MTVLFRAMWTDSRIDAREATVETFAAWFAQKTGTTLGPVTATNTSRHEHGGIEAADDGVRWFSRAVLIETRADGSRWETTLRVWPDDVDAHRTWIWVDVDAVAPAGLPSVRISAPRFVAELLRDGVNPRSGPVLLTGDPQYVAGYEAGEDLAESLTSIERSCPVVVFSHHPVVVAQNLRSTSFEFSDVPRLVAQHLAGAVAVVVADPAACEGLAEAVGREHGVWSGACRTYLPDLDPALDRPHHHPTLLADRYLRSPGIALEAVRRSVASTTTTRRPPPSFARAKAVLDAQRRGMHADHEWISELEAENGLLTNELRLVKARVEDLERELLDNAADVETSVQMNADLRQQLMVINTQLAAVWETADTRDARSRPGLLPPPELPIRAGSCSEAADLARLHLADRLALPDRACRDLQDLDAAAEAVSWGQKSWDGFVALGAYAEHLADPDVENRDFWSWCQHSGDPRAWPATPKHLAMVESETVRNKAKLRQARIFPVATSVEPDGTMYMEAHLKIATGGGMLAPRVYFHVDSRTAVVHVGFFGPHKWVPNTKT